MPPPLDVSARRSLGAAAAPCRRGWRCRPSSPSGGCCGGGRPCERGCWCVWAKWERVAPVKHSEGGSLSRLPCAIAVRASVSPRFPRNRRNARRRLAPPARACLRDASFRRGAPIPNGRRYTLRLLSPHFSCQSSAHRIVRAPKQGVARRRGVARAPHALTRTDSSSASYAGAHSHDAEAARGTSSRAPPSRRRPATPRSRRDELRRPASLGLGASEDATRPTSAPPRTASRRRRTRR